MRAGRIAVTGVGVLTAIGGDRSHLLSAGATAVRPRSFAPYPGFPPMDGVYAASLLELPIGSLLPARGVRAISEEGRAALCSAVLACREAGLEPAARAEAGVALGTMRAGLDEYARLFSEGVAFGPDRVNPARGPRTGYNTPASELSIFLGAAGPNLTISTGAASSGDAIATAADMVRGGEVDVMLAGGVDVLSYMAVHAERALDPGFGTIAEPLPFDRDRAGSAPGEAAAVLVLEDADRAAHRGAALLAELVGTGSGFDPSASGAGSAVAARRALEQALACGGLPAGAVDAVIASACGSPGTDAAEAHALGAVLGGRPAVCSVAGALGDCAGAGAAVRAALAIAALGSGTLPATCGLRVPDPAFAELRVTVRPLSCDLRLVMALSVDPGGHASAILLKRVGEVE